MSSNKKPNDSGSDDSDVDHDIQIPVGVRLNRIGKGNEAPRPKRAQPLRVANDIDDDSSPERSRRGHKRPLDHDSNSDSEEFQENGHPDVIPDSDEEIADKGKTRRSENHPPLNRGRPISKRANMDESSDGEKSDSDLTVQNNHKKPNARARKRLSIRRLETSMAGSAVSVQSSASSVPVPPTPDPETLRKIYSTCIDMFNTHKITQDNAFQLRFLDLMGEIIEMPDFDKNDMHGAGRTLETGAKIYVCRVDKTKHAVMDLASTLNAQSRKKTRNDDEENDDENAEGPPDVSMRDESEKQKKKKRKKKMKASRFIVENEAKISVILEDDSTTPAVRRETLKNMFNAAGDEDVDFDYDGFFYDRASDHPLSNPEEQVFVLNVSPVSEAMVNLAQSQKLEFIPFLQVAEYERVASDIDIWGLPIDPSSDFDPNRESVIMPDEMEPNPVSPVEVDEPGLGYNVEDRPADYGPEDLEDNNFGNDTFVNEDDLVVDIEGRPVVDVHKIRNLQEFYDMYNKIKSKYGWCGPTFVRPQLNLFNRDANQGPKKARTKKDPIILDYKESDWQSQPNKYQTSNGEKTVFDERTIVKWSLAGKCVQPYIGIEDSDEELEDFDKCMASETQANENFLPTIFRYFLDPRRNILEGLQRLVKDEDDEEHHEFHKEEDDYIEDAGFDIERHRDIDDSGRDMGVHMEGHDENLHMDVDMLGAAIEGSFAFPASLGGVLMESNGDPISRASDGDSIKFTKKPKPIDMHALKRAILKFLKEQLRLHDDGHPIEDVETRTDLQSLVNAIIHTVDKKMVEHLSIAIIVVGLMHVVVDKKLFMVLEKEEPYNPRIVCRGKSWKHADNIPLPDIVDDEELFNARN